MDYRLDIVELSECRWTGSGRNSARDGVEILYSGILEEGPHAHEVALILSPNTANDSSDNNSSEDEKDQFYFSLKNVIKGVPTHDVLVVMGDLNA